MPNASSHLWLQIANQVVGSSCLAMSIGLALVFTLTRSGGRVLPPHRRLMLTGLSFVLFAASSRFMPLSILHELTGGSYLVGGGLLIAVALLLLSLTVALRGSRNRSLGASS
jgi:hypothetical protein